MTDSTGLHSEDPPNDLANAASTTATTSSSGGAEADDVSTNAQHETTESEEETGNNEEKDDHAPAPSGSSANAPIDVPASGSTTPDGDGDLSMASITEIPAPAPESPKTKWQGFRQHVNTAITAENKKFVAKPVKAPTAPAAKASDDNSVSSMRLKQTLQAAKTAFFVAERPKAPEDRSWQDPISFTLVPHSVHETNEEEEKRIRKELERIFNETKGDFDLNSFRLVVYGDRMVPHRLNFKEHTPKEGCREDVTNGWDYLDPTRLTDDNEACLATIGAMLQRIAEVNDFPYTITRVQFGTDLKIRTALMYFYLPEYMNPDIQDAIEEKHLEAILTQLQTQVTQFCPSARVNRRVHLNKMGDIEGAPRPSYMVKVDMRDNIPAEMKDFMLIMDPTRDHFTGLQAVKVHFAHGHGVCVKCKRTDHTRFNCHARIGQITHPKVFTAIAAIGKIELSPEKAALKKPTPMPKPPPQAKTTTTGWQRSPHHGSKSRPQSTAASPERSAQDEVNHRAKTNVYEHFNKGDSNQEAEEDDDLEMDSASNHLVSQHAPTSQALTTSTPDLLQQTHVPSTSDSPSVNLSPLKANPGKQVELSRAGAVVETIASTTPSKERGPSKTAQAVGEVPGTPTRDTGSGRGNTALEGSAPGSPSRFYTPGGEGKRGRSTSSPGSASKGGASPSKRLFRSHSVNQENRTTKLMEEHVSIFDSSVDSPVTFSFHPEGFAEDKLASLPAKLVRQVCQRQNLPEGLRKTHLYVYHKKEALTTWDDLVVPTSDRVTVLSTLAELEQLVNNIPSSEHHESTTQARPAELK